MPFLGGALIFAGGVLLVWADQELAGCSDECHGLAVPVLGGAVLMLIGVLTICVWGYFKFLESREKRQISARDRRLRELKRQILGRDG